MLRKLQLHIAVLLCFISFFPVSAHTSVPADKSIVTTNDKVNGYETTYRKYDASFYEAPCPQSGTIVKLNYTTNVYGSQSENWVNVYLPYGYEKSSDKYNILYFYHGTNETQDSFIGNERVKNAIDNMIYSGIAKPFIMVLPTYYYDYSTRACDLDLFQEEMRRSIIPAVESQFRTYAETTDNAGLAASRDHRAFAGYSQGCRMCWYSFQHMLDLARYFIPMSNGLGTQGICKAIDEHAEYKNDFFVYVGCGGPRDVLQDATVNMVNQLLAIPGYFRFGTDPTVDNLYITISKDIHQTLVARFFLYNAFCDVLWTE